LIASFIKHDTMLLNPEFELLAVSSSLPRDSHGAIVASFRLGKLPGIRLASTPIV
jgi:hypothetical protein